MKKSRLSRRDFLKRIGFLSFAPVFLSMGRLFHLGKGTQQKKRPLRQAKYWKSADHLAG